MAVPSAYLMSTKNTAKILAAIQKAAVPQSFTYEFLKHLGYASSGDRPMIPVLKAIGFLDESGKPTALYREYKDPALAKRALAQGLRAGYSDLFKIDTEAHTKSSGDLTGMFARLAEKGDAVTQKMATTFYTLAQLADFTEAGKQEQSDNAGDDDVEDGAEQEQEQPGRQGRANGGSGATLALRHDIHVHLPLSTDVAVYDAIFKSLRENLM